MSNIIINQSVAILIDGNNIERALHKKTGETSAMLNFDTMIPRLLDNRGLNRLIYFKEGKNISSKLADRLHENYHGSVVPCHKSADIPLTINATEIAEKVDTIIILSGDSDYVELVRHLKSQGVRVEIAAVAHSLAGILKDEADYCHDITEEDCFIYKSKSRNTRSWNKGGSSNSRSSNSNSGNSNSGNSNSGNSSSNSDSNKKSEGENNSKADSQSQSQSKGQSQAEKQSGKKEAPKRKPIPKDKKTATKSPAKSTAKPKAAKTTKEVNTKKPAAKKPTAKKTTKPAAPKPNATKE